MLSQVKERTYNIHPPPPQPSFLHPFFHLFLEGVGGFAWEPGYTRYSLPCKNKKKSESICTSQYFRSTFSFPFFLHPWLVWPNPKPPHWLEIFLTTTLKGAQSQQPNGGVLVNWEKDWGWIPDIDLALESQNKIISICETDLSKKVPKVQQAPKVYRPLPGLQFFLTLLTDKIRK